MNRPVDDAVKRAAAAMSDYLTMLGVDPDDVGEGGVGTTAEVLARVALAAAGAGDAVDRGVLSVAEVVAEAERRYPSYPAVGFSGADDRQRAFRDGVAWALAAGGDAAPTVTAERVERALRVANVQWIAQDAGGDPEWVVQTVLAALGVEAVQP